MNYILPHIPKRGEKPREKGITSVMDKGLSLRQAQDMIAVSGHLIDVVKIGFGTSIISHQLKEKISFYKRSKLKVYFGGTLFEAFLIRDMMDDYKKYMSQYGIEMLEVSDGSMILDHHRKCELIQEFSKDFEVISEVGSKDPNKVLTNEVWINEIQHELDAGAWKVIAEARESGTVGIYDKEGKANKVLIEMISNNINFNNIVWEAPLKAQQVWFINEFGYNVNLGNIAPTEVIPLETLRIGLRGDTFHNYLP